MPQELNRIVNVVVPRRVWESYDYLVPDDMAMPAVGSRVRVPLGHGRAVGLVIGTVKQSSFELKPILRVIDELPLVSREVVELGQWISEYYHHPLGSVFETILPTAATRGTPAKTEPEKQWSLIDAEVSPDIKANAKRQLQAWESLKTLGAIRETQLKNFDVQKTALEALVRKGIVEQSSFEPELEITSSPLKATNEQRLAINSIKESLSEFETFLLDGITGSGKTEVYLQVIEEVLRQGQQALVLVPEIALTPQITKRFQERFNRVGILHSKIPSGRRFDTWTQAATGRLRVIIGTRSAVFTPFKRLGIIVVDEEHDHSYKQTESLHYSGRDIAVMRASKLGIPCVLGSATPSMETIVNARKQRYRYLRLARRPGTARLPSFHVQDMRLTSVRGGICEPLLQRIGEHLERNNQVLILINRRGHSTQYFCGACDWKACCTDCDVKLTLHEVPRRYLQCHACGKKYEAVETCPDCSSDVMGNLGVGTQQVEQTLEAEFPDVPLYRIDRDNIRTHSQLTTMFDHLQQTNEGILVGTQMLAKGHHFPNVTLVAVIAADYGFLSTDFRGPERTAQLIVQVAGRAGRAEKRGEVWIQSFEPENADLKSLVEKGYEGFTETELQLRREANFPPFGHMAVIRSEGTDERMAEDFCSEVLHQLRGTGVTVLGPASAPIARVAKQYRFQGIVLARYRRELHGALKTVERMRPKSRKTRWSIDVDPSEMA